MALTNAEKQARWRERNVVKLTDPAMEIAEMLIEMDDQAKLRKIAAFINDHLKHPDRTAEERSVARGRVIILGLRQVERNHPTIFPACANHRSQADVRLIPSQAPLSDIVMVCQYFKAQQVMA